jgi:serine/threonine-protein kinase HipA
MSRIVASYNGLKVGLLAEARGRIVFEYDAGFIASGHELSPLQLPLGPGLRARDSAPTMRLPGLFDDSLPDSWGRRVMLEWFRQRGTPEHAVTPLMMLAYVGQRGMGALTYEPALEVAAPDPRVVSLARLHEAALRAENAGPINLEAFAQIGSSAGGARPKALLALPRDGGDLLLAGTDLLPDTHEAWLVKFDTSRTGIGGPMEEAYARMARAAGIDMPETRLLETRPEPGTLRHFAVKRFDREGRERIHHHTLAALCQVGGGDLSYETFLRVTRRLTLDEREVWRAYRRAVFNVLASNRDDHGKNHGFLHRHRAWKLGPAYDLTFSSPPQLPERGMAIAGERRTATTAHLLKLAESEALDRRTALGIIEEVRGAVSRWRTFARQAGVPALQVTDVEAVLRPLLKGK